MECQAQQIIHTIGHSTRTIETFIDLSKAHNLQRLIDVRRWPSSRRYPHFQSAALSAALDRVQIDYVWRGDLGGFRKPSNDSPNSAWRVGAFRAYADFMLTIEFNRIMLEIERLAKDKRSVLMCAEAVPWHCHRQLLADAFLVRGWSVRHILDDGCHEHKLPDFARVEGQRIVYPRRESN
ncbi:MAG: DUF488 family protein [Candidatus Binatia bacterium]